MTLPLGPAWVDADSETLRAHVLAQGVSLRDKYRHLFVVGALPCPSRMPLTLPVALPKRAPCLVSTFDPDDD